MNIRYVLTEKWDNSAIFRIVAMLFLFVSNFVIFLVSAKLLASIPGWLGISFLSRHDGGSEIFANEARFYLVGRVGR